MFMIFIISQKHRFDTFKTYFISIQIVFLNRLNLVLCFFFYHSSYGIFSNALYHDDLLGKLHQQFLLVLYSFILFYHFDTRDDQLIKSLTHGNARTPSFSKQVMLVIQSHCGLWVYEPQLMKLPRNNHTGGYIDSISSHQTVLILKQNQLMS